MAQAMNFKARAFAGGTLLVLALIKNLAGENITASELSAIRYTVYSLGVHTNSTRTAVTGHENVSLNVADVFSAVRTLTVGGTERSYNFRWTPDRDTNEVFPNPDQKYLVRIDFDAANGFISPVQILVETI